jgi:hypothetical protein
MGLSDEEYVRLIANYEMAGYLAQFWPEVGQRDEAAKDLAGVLLRVGWTEDETDGFVRLVARQAGDEEWRKRGKARTTARKLAAGGEAPGGPSLARRLKGDGARVVAHLYAWLGRPEQRRYYFRSVAPQPATWLPEPPKVEMGDVEIEPWSLLASDLEEKPVRWLWRGRIPLGTITVLDGDPGLGKSLLALDLAARVTTGRDMPDTTPGVDGGVVLLSAEDDLAATVRPRLETAWADLDRLGGPGPRGDDAGSHTL